MIFRVKQQHLRAASKKWITVPHDLILDESISDKARCLLLYMLTKSGKWVFRQSQLAKKFHVSRQTITRWFKELKASGYLYLQGMSDKEGEGRKVWTYLVFPLPMGTYFNVIGKAKPEELPETKIVHVDFQAERKAK